MSDKDSQPLDNSENDPTPASEEPVVENRVVSLCPECNEQVDVTTLSPFTKIECPYCSASYRVKDQLGNYQITGMLGEGGMSQVFLATDLTLNRPVALKILHQTLSLDSALIAMFEREATLTASINHPNVVKVYTASTDKGYFYIAMELVDNISIEQMIAQEGAIDEHRVLDIAHDVTNGLKAAFAEGLIHRDIKPGNMLVTSSGLAKLVDFGLAVQQGGEDLVEDLWATPFYVPPEKLDNEPDTFLGDIYSLGATFFHALAGAPPFEANTSSLEELKAIKAKPVSLKAVAPNVSKPVIDLIEKMMAYSPDDRPSSYESLLELIETAMEAVPGTTKKRTGRAAGKGNGISPGMRKGIIGGAVALFFGIVVILVALNKGDDDIDNSLIGGDDRVIGGEGISAKFNAGREAVQAGNFKTAATEFAALAEEPDLAQPTRGWVLLNQGVIELLNGKEVDSRKHFARLADSTGFPKEPSEKLASRREFFESVAEFGFGKLPVMPEVADEFPTASYKSIGIFVAGLKNWNLQEFESGATYFKKFAESAMPDGFEWAGGYQNRARAYLDDYELLKKLPNPTGQTTSGDLIGMERELAAAAAKLKTGGAARKFIKERERRCSELETFRAESHRLAKLAVADPPAKEQDEPPEKSSTPPDPQPITKGPWTAAEKAELDELNKAIEEATGLASTYYFSAAALKIESVTFKSKRVAELHKDTLEFYNLADDFVERFTAEIGQAQYEGIVRRKEGLPLDAKITASTRESLTVNLGFGDNTVELDKFAAGWIREAAEQTFLNPAKTPPGEEPSIWQQAACFALMSNQSDDATRLAGEVSDHIPGFEEQWTRMQNAGLHGLSAPDTE